MKAHRRTHNKMPGSRKQRKRPSDKLIKEEPSFEDVELIKEEDIDIFHEESFEEEFITS